MSLGSVRDRVTDTTVVPKRYGGAHACIGTFGFFRIHLHHGHHARPQQHPGSYDGRPGRIQGQYPCSCRDLRRFFCVMAICGVLSFSFSVLSASFLQIMRYIGSAYLLWLAWKTAMPKAGGNSDGRADAGFMTGFVLQLVNVKIMVYGMTAYSAFILPHHDSVAALLAGMCFLTMMGSLGTIVWAVAGASLQSVFQRHARVTNGSLGALLVGCAWSLLDQ